MHKSYVVLLIGTFALCGCAHSSSYTRSNLERNFATHPVNEFFRDYGFPFGSIENKNGSDIYLWSSIDVDKFASQARPVTYYSNNGVYPVVDNDSGNMQREYCQLRIYTDKAGTIEKIDITVDSVGKWSNSRCSEIF